MIPYYGKLRQYEKKDTPHLCYLPQIKIARYTALNEAYILIRLGNHYLMPFNNCFCTIYFFEPFLLFCIRPFRLLYCNRNNHRFDTFSSRGELDSMGCVPLGDFLFSYVSFTILTETDVLWADSPQSIKCKTTGGTSVTFSLLKKLPTDSRKFSFIPRYSRRER